MGKAGRPKSNGNLRITTESTVDAGTMALCLDMSRTQIYRLVSDGVMSTDDDGNINLIEGLHNYKEYRLNLDKSDEDIRIEAEKRKAEASIKKSKATIADLEAKELQGKMHRSEDVKKMTESLIYTIRGMLIALPGMVAKDTAAATSATETADIVKREIDHVLDELSLFDYDPVFYENEVRERRNWAANENHGEEN